MQFVQGLCGFLRVLHDRIFRQLDFELLRFDAVAGKRGGDSLDQRGAAKLEGGKIDRDRYDVDVIGLPFCDLAAGFV